MSARRLGRLAGLVFVLVAIVGGTAAGAAKSVDTSAVVCSTLEYIWD